MEAVAAPPLKKRKSNLASVRQFSFREIVACFGNKEDSFYVVDSSQIEYRLSLLRPFKTDDFSFFVVDRGSITVKLDVGIYTLTKGAVLIKRPTSIFQVQSFSANCHFRIFGFTSEFVSASGLNKKHIEALSLISSHGHPMLTLPAEETERIYPVLDLLQQKHNLAKKHPYYDDAVCHAFCLFVLELAGIHTQKATDQITALTRKEHLTYEFFKLIPLHIQKDRSVNYYASLLHVTPKHLSKTIKDVTGKTSGEIIDEMVVQEAKVLLDDPSFSVSEV
ncbi:MAG TPA: hypothetical protein VMR70_06180, partial [Flavisolibacter sp.]|nr:hypothetical protein [Flavisolibacter sp.]